MYCNTAPAHTPCPARDPKNPKNPKNQRTRAEDEKDPLVRGLGNRALPSAVCPALITAHHSRAVPPPPAPPPVSAQGCCLRSQPRNVSRLRRQESANQGGGFARSRRELVEHISFHLLPPSPVPSSLSRSLALSFSLDPSCVFSGSILYIGFFFSPHYHSPQTDRQTDRHLYVLATAQMVTSFAPLYATSGSFLTSSSSCCSSSPP